MLPKSLIIFAWMKRLTAIAILAFYSLSTLGIGIRQFYCCGQLKSVEVTFTHEANDKCDKGNGKGGCCKTEHQFLKVKDSHIAPGDVSIPTNFVADISFIGFSNELIAINPGQALTNNNIHAPPLPSRPIYILNCVYRI
jgi:hypothetical protein